MKKIDTGFDGLYILETNNFTDTRGSFQKLFNSKWFFENGLSTEFKEFYYSVSHKNVIRGMHFQLPPHEHSKLVYVSQGGIIDVVVDLRRNSQTFGKYFSIVLSSTDVRYLYIPVGFAHGFQALEDNTIVNYAQTSCYNKEADVGIHYKSFGFDWKYENTIVSERDCGFVAFEDFKTIF